MEIPIWLQWIGFGGGVYIVGWVYALGKKVGTHNAEMNALKDSLETHFKSQDAAMAELKREFNNRVPLAGCQNVFREFTQDLGELKGDIGRLNGNVEILIKELKRDK